MNSRHQDQLRNGALLMLGATIGVLGISIYSPTGAGSPLSREFWQSMKLSFGTHEVLASACTPQEQNDDIFFLTCGGIY